MIDPRQLLTDLQARQRKLEQDLRQQAEQIPDIKARLEADYKAARDAERTAATWQAWRDEQVTQAAVAWLLACTFVRFCEDNGLLQTPRLAGPGDALRRARDAMQVYFRAHPTDNERHYLQHVFDQVAALPAMTGLLGREHNPLFALPPSYEAARELLGFWQATDPDTGALRRDFTDPALDTRFLGDLYQDLSEAARKRYALLQTPEFVEEFILERTLEPAIKTFGLEGIRLIDPTCGSGHFLLGAFQRLLGHWQRQAPGLDAREHVIHALAGVHGVDLNPFAVAIARFRLLVAALAASGIATLREAPSWDFRLATGDSLLHGPRLGTDELTLDEIGMGGTGAGNEYAHVYASEDFEALHRLLGQRYHAVVGNPPYIRQSDKALNALYRERYLQTCYRQFSLGVPFTERFFQLAETPRDAAPAGFVGLITADSFMKREFGKKLIEHWLPRQDLTHLIHTSGAYIPGHGTPTVILLGRNRAPVADHVRAVLGIRGEPATPEDPAQGLVWRSIVELTDRPGEANEFISAADMPRERLASHPWSLQGGVAPDVIQQIDSVAKATINEETDKIGFVCMTRADDVYFTPRSALIRHGIPPAHIVENVEGDRVRDWIIDRPNTTLFPYDSELKPILDSPQSPTIRFLWPHRAGLWLRREPNGNHREIGLKWYEWSRFLRGRYRIPLSITFAFVATHNHFVLDRGGKVFKQSAPVIKLPADADEDQHLGLLGLLNSSTACFWMKQNLHNKGGGGIGGGLASEEWEKFYEHTGTGMQAFPLPDQRPLELARQLDALARERQAHLPAALAEQLPLARAALDAHRDAAAALRARMLALQEELDWWCYRAYGLLDADLTLGHEPPGIAPGERAFEIVLARRFEADEVQTQWFERHGATPITAIPEHWSADYRALVARRIELIETSDWFALLERPEYKRRWQQAPWAKLEQAALRAWLLERLETQAYWPEPALQRVAELAARAAADADFLAVGQVLTGQPGFDVPALLDELLAGESVPALKALRYQPSGLRRRADWEHTWNQQRREDAIDAEVARANPQRDGETDADWRARIQPERERRKLEEIGRLPAPPKYKSSDFRKTAYWRLRGKLDVPKERFFTAPDPENPGQWLYGWAGFNPAQRVQALAGAWIAGEEQSGAQPESLQPLLIAIDEALPWVLQWHNQIDPATDVRPGDYFQTWLGEQLNHHGWTRETLTNWQAPTPTRRRRKRKA